MCQPAQQSRLIIQPRGALASRCKRGQKMLFGPGKIACGRGCHALAEESLDENKRD